MMAKLNTTAAGKKVFMSIAGTSAADILSRIEECFTAEEIVQAYPNIKPEEMTKYLSYVNAILANERIRVMDLDLAS